MCYNPLLEQYKNQVYEEMFITQNQFPNSDVLQPSIRTIQNSSLRRNVHHKTSSQIVTCYNPLLEQYKNQVYGEMFITQNQFPNSDVLQPSIRPKQKREKVGTPSFL